MKRILFGLLVAGVALSASAFSLLVPVVFYNTGPTNSTTLSDYKYIPGGSCDPSLIDNCSVTFYLEATPAEDTPLDIAIPTLTDLSGTTIAKGTYDN